MKKLFNRLFVTTCMAALLSLVSVSTASAAEVTLYAANSEDSIQTVLDVVRKQAPDLKVNVIRAKTGALLQRIVAEKKKPVGDVFWSSGFGTLASYTDVAKSYNSKAASAIPSSMHGPENKWLGSNVHVVVLMVNKKQLKGSAPKGWEDILFGDGKERVAFADPSASSSAYLQLFGIYKKYGEEGVKKLAEKVIVTGGSSSVYKGVAQGEYAVGITIEYAAYRYVAGGQKSIKLVYPKEGTFLSPEGMFIIKNAPHSKEAKRLFEIMASKAAQEKIFEKSYRRPTRSDVEVSKISSLPDYSEINIFEIDQTEAGANKNRVIKLWKNALASK